MLCGIQFIGTEDFGDLFPNYRVGIALHCCLNLEQWSVQLI
jgi:hypothetical protein